MVWSVDKFQTHIQNIGTIPGGISASYEMPLYNEIGSELPYDVEYFDDQRAFYMVFRTTVYVAFTEDIDGAGPAQMLPHVYTPSAPLVTPLQTYGETISYNCFSETNYKGSNYGCSYGYTGSYKFQDDNATNLWGIQACMGANSGLDVDGIFCEYNYDVTNTTSPRMHMTNLHGTAYQSCTYPPSGWNVDNISAVAYWTGSDWRYDIEGQIDFCQTGEMNQDVSTDTLPSPQDDWLQHYFVGNLYFKNFTVPYVNGTIQRSATTDFVSYGTTSAVYTEAGHPTNESINQSDSDIGGTTSFYIWERNSAGDRGNDGVWIHSETNYQINVESTTGREASVVLYANCTGADYYDSGSGELFTLNSPCQYNNQLIITGSNRPSSWVDYVDINDSCVDDGLTVTVLYADTPYTHTFTVRTDTNLPISGANVTIPGEGTNTTDSNGQTTFELQTISGATLERRNTSECIIDFSTDGTGVATSYSIEKSGFVDSSGTIPVPVKGDLAGRWNDWSFTTSTQETLYDSGMFLNVSLQIGSAIEISPCNYEINASGPDLIQVMVNDVPQTRTDYDEFPMEYKFNHSSEPVNITLDLTLPNGSVITEWHNLSYDERDDHIFFLPFAIDTLICDSNCDCPESTCIGKYFYDAETTACSGGLCQYNISNCQLATFCDDLVGCFDVATTQSCTKDSQCPDSCVDADTMVWGRCGADGLCKNVTYDCAVECNQTAGICEELRECEQGSSFTAKAYTYISGSQFNLLSGSFSCGLGNVGEASCVGGGLEDNFISKAQLDFLGKTIADVYVTPTGWTYTTSADGLYYNFTDISVICNSDCSISYTICEGNCDQDEGECAEAVGSLENTVRSLLPVWLQWLLTSLFLWTLLSLIIGAVLTYIPARISPNAQPTPQFGMAGMFVMYMIGIPLGYVDPFIGLVIIIGIGLYLAKMISSSMAGG
jgi:hypothetical protein